MTWFQHDLFSTTRLFGCSSYKALWSISSWKLWYLKDLIYIYIINMYKYTFCCCCCCYLLFGSINPNFGCCCCSLLITESSIKERKEDNKISILYVKSNKEVISHLDLIGYCLILFFYIFFRNNDSN